MPSSIIKYRVFLASPSDLGFDRDSIDEVIQELNLTFGKQHNLVIELLKWETHSGPGVSTSDQQSIINNDLGNDYDIFIGLLWKRFGTPTENSDSGTEEEFLNAHSRFIKDPSSLQILFYFKNTPIPPMEINPEQLAKIKKFREDLGEKNVLYFEYQEIEQLSKYLRIHIPKRIRDLQSLNNHKEQTNTIEYTSNQLEVEDYLGVIDYQDMIEDYMDDTTKSLLRISEATEWIGAQMTKKSSEINALTIGGNQPGRKELRDLLKRTAMSMENFAKRIEPELPIYHDSFQKSIDAFSKLINLSKDDLEVKEEEITEIKETLISLVKSISGGIDSMSSFHDSVNSLPRLSKELNKARAYVSSKLEHFISNLTVNHSIATELLKSLD